MARNCRGKPLRCGDLEACEPHVSIKHLTAVQDWPKNTRETRAKRSPKQRADAARPWPDAPEEAPGALPKHPASHVVSLQPGRGGGCVMALPAGHTGSGEHRARQPSVTHRGLLTRPRMGHPVCLPFPTKKARAQHWVVAGPMAVITRRTDLAQASGPA